LETQDIKVEISSAWETIRQNIKISAKENLRCYELKQQKEWIYEAYSELLKNEGKRNCSG
jgi:fructose-1-phosphate kinase PfkB-like protein